MPIFQEQIQTSPLVEQLMTEASQLEVAMHPSAQFAPARKSRLQNIHMERNFDTIYHKSTLRHRQAKRKDCKQEGTLHSESAEANCPNSNAASLWLPVQHELQSAMMI